MMVNGHDGALIWDVQSDSLLRTLASDIQYGVFASSFDRFIGLARGKTYVYDLHTWGILGQFAIELTSGIGVRGTSQVIGLDVYRRQVLNVFDFATEQVVDSIVTRFPSEDALADHWHLAVSPDGRYLYASVIEGSGGGEAAVVCHDLMADSVTFLRRSPWVTSISITPDGSELWTAELNGAPGTITVWDAVSGVPLDTIHTHEAGGNWIEQVVYSEASDKAYIVTRSSGFFGSFRPTIVLDLKSRTVLGHLKGDPQRGYDWIAHLGSSE
jgi:WD40 repeat protein